MDLRLNQSLMTYTGLLHNKYDNYLEGHRHQQDTATSGHKAIICSCEFCYN